MVVNRFIAGRFMYFQGVRTRYRKSAFLGALPLSYRRTKNSPGGIRTHDLLRDRDNRNPGARTPMMKVFLAREAGLEPTVAVLETAAFAAKLHPQMIGTDRGNRTHRFRGHDPASCH